jgi:hypothetical protein
MTPIPSPIDSAPPVNHLIPTLMRRAADARAVDELL